MEPLKRHEQFMLFIYILTEGELSGSVKDDPIAAFARLLNISLEEAIEAEAFAVEYGYVNKE